MNKKRVFIVVIILLSPIVAFVVGAGISASYRGVKVSITADSVTEIMDYFLFGFITVALLIIGVHRLFKWFKRK